jgi:hypothetical protein
MLDSLDTGFGNSNKIIVERPKPEIKADDYTIKICNKDCPKEDIVISENIVPTVVIKNNCVVREDSIIGELDTGFGAD